METLTAESDDVKKRKENTIQLTLSNSNPRNSNISIIRTNLKSL